VAPRLHRPKQTSKLPTTLPQLQLSQLRENAYKVSNSPVLNSLLLKVTVVPWLSISSNANAFRAREALVVPERVIVLGKVLALDLRRTILLLILELRLLTLPICLLACKVSNRLSYTINLTMECSQIHTHPMTILGCRKINKIRSLLSEATLVVTL